MSALPKIFVFCNSCSPGWHSAVALSENGHGLAGHICSEHGWIPHDMGIGSNWKHEVYLKHYPDGFEIEYVEDPENHPGWLAAVELNKARQAAPAQGA